MSVGGQADLASIDASAWADLEKAATDPQSDYRYINLCSVDAAGRPQARMVVLRYADPIRHTLEIHTDIRSSKWTEIAANPSVTILGYCPTSRVQLRLQGTATLHGPGSHLADQAWGKLSDRKRSTYTGGPPGDELVTETSASAGQVQDAGGKAIFGVLTVQAESLDWCKLGEADIQRSLFTYDELGGLADARWINP